MQGSPVFPAVVLALRARCVLIKSVGRTERDAGVKYTRAAAHALVGGTGDRLRLAGHVQVQWKNRFRFLVGNGFSRFLVSERPLTETVYGLPYIAGCVTMA